MIDTKSITNLRELTGAGIADCKLSLEESDGDLDKAVEIMRKKGVLKAAKKADRATNEGVIAIAKGDKKVATVGLACETDFVARTDDFIKTVDEFSAKLLEVGVEEFKNWADEKIKNELVVKIGENLQLVDAEIIEGEVIGTYLHSNKKVAAVVVASSGSQELVDDLAMQVTAMSPKYVKPEDIPAEVIEQEKGIYKEQLKSEDKPEAMWNKIIPGKLNKYYQEVCLLNQAFIKDDKMTVEALIKQQEAGTEVIKFSRYQI